MATLKHTFPFHFFTSRPTFFFSLSIYPSLSLSIIFLLTLLLPFASPPLSIFLSLSLSLSHVHHEILDKRNSENFPNGQYFPNALYARTTCSNNVCRRLNLPSKCESIQFHGYYGHYAVQRQSYSDCYHWIGWSNSQSVGAVSKVSCSKSNCASCSLSIYLWLYYIYIHCVIIYVYLDKNILIYIHKNWTIGNKLTKIYFHDYKKYQWSYIFYKSTNSQNILGGRGDLERTITNLTPPLPTGYSLYAATQLWRMIILLQYFKHWTSCHLAFSPCQLNRHRVLPRLVLFSLVWRKIFMGVKLSDVIGVGR